MIGSHVSYEDLDVVLVVRDPATKSVDTETLINDLTETVEELQQQHSSLENLQVVEIDPYGPVYHQIFAFRRARCVSLLLVWHLLDID